MKRFIAAILMAVLLISALTGCSGDVPENSVFTREDALSKKMGAIADTAAAVYAGGRGDLTPYSSGEELIIALKSGALDCVVAEKPNAEKLLKGERRLTVLDEPMLSAEFRFAVAKENADLTEDINAALSQLSEAGTLQSIVDSFFGNTEYTYIPAEYPEGQEPAAKLTLAVGDDFAPYKFTDENGEITGIDVTVARAVCDVLGLGLEVVEKSSVDLISSVRSGSVHFAAGGITNADENTRLVDITEGYTTCVMQIIVRKK